MGKRRANGCILFYLYRYVSWCAADPLAIPNYFMGTIQVRNSCTFINSNVLCEFNKII